jgi:pimeloyl-ACP methyl ester carboxylesterase
MVLIEEPTLYNKRSDVLTLPNGRKLGYAQYGSPSGKLVFMLHGMPGSRLDAAHFDVVGKELRARVIRIDRPGIGWSSPRPSRTLRNHIKDVEAVADALNIEKFKIMVFAVTYCGRTY